MPDIKHKTKIAAAETRATGSGPGTKSFTLVELLVVLVVIAVLAGITISISKLAGWRAKQAQSEAELQKIKNALEEYRAVYGEYPIVGDPRHYGYPPNAPWPTNVWKPDGANWDGVSVPTDIWSGSDSNVPPEDRVVNLMEPVVVGTRTNYAIEVLQFGTQITNNFQLVYPLKIRPELEGRKAFMDFPIMTVCYLVWSKHSQTNVFESVGVRGTVVKYIRGDQVNRARAIDPANNRQWFYDCTNGMTYLLWSTNGFL